MSVPSVSRGRSLGGDTAVAVGPAVGCSTAAAVGVLAACIAEPRLLVLGTVALGLGVVLLRFPETALVAFVFVGSFKGTDSLSAVARAAPGGADLTLVAAVGLVVATGAALWRRRADPIALPAAAAWFLTLGVLLLVDSLHSPDPGAGVAKALTFQTFSALAFLAPLAIVRSRSNLIRVATLLVAVGTVTALLVQPAARSESVLVLAGADNEIQVGLVLGMPIVAIVAYLWPLSSGWMRLLWLVPGALIATKLVSSGARSAVLGTALACLLALALLARTGRRERTAAAALAGAVALLLPVAWAGTNPAVQDRYASTVAGLSAGAGLDAGGAERSDLARSALELFAAHPLGTGTGSYRALTGYEWPHNILLELASELGVPGVAAFVAFLAGIGAALVRAGRSYGLRREAIAAGSLLVLPLTVSFASFDLNGNRLLWFAAGLALAAARLSEAES